MMGSIFIDLIKKEYIIIYMDDILIFAEQKIYSRNTLGWPLILQWLWEHDLENMTSTWNQRNVNSKRKRLNI